MESLGDFSSGVSLGWTVRWVQEAGDWFVCRFVKLSRKQEVLWVVWPVIGHSQVVNVKAVTVVVAQHVQWGASRWL